MPNPENLIPAKKGEIRNPNGRPVGSKSRSTIARMVLESIVNLPEESFNQVQSLFPGFSKGSSIETVGYFMQAAKVITDQDTLAFNSMLNSAYGQPKQEIELDAKVENVTNFDTLTDEELDKLSEIYTKIEP